MSHAVPVEKAQIKLSLVPEAETESRLSLGDAPRAQASQFGFRGQDGLDLTSGQSQGPTLFVTLRGTWDKDPLRGAEPGAKLLFGSGHGGQLAACLQLLPNLQHETCPNGRV